MTLNVVQCALRVLGEPEPEVKARLSAEYLAAWQAGELGCTDLASHHGHVPDRPARADDKVACFHVGLHRWSAWDLHACRVPPWVQTLTTPPSQTMSMFKMHDGSAGAGRALIPADKPRALRTHLPPPIPPPFLSSSS